MAKEMNDLSLSQLAAELHVSVSTCWRWSLKGVRGVKLQTHLVGGRRRVHREDLAAFLAALDGGSQPPATDGRHRDLEDELDAAGL